jgi:rubredoxin
MENCKEDAAKAVHACLMCGYSYDEAVGDPAQAVAAGTPWESLPQNWLCPECGATKEEFEPI